MCCIFKIVLVYLGFNECFFVFMLEGNKFDLLYIMGYKILWGDFVFVIYIIFLYLEIIKEIRNYI